jgi:1-deoxy-D-xylulose-5-phosphate synthase
MVSIAIGKSRQLSEGDDLAILTIGTMGIPASRVVKMLQKDEIAAAHFDMRFVKPLDEDALQGIFRKYKKVITIEDGVLQGGFGSAVLEFMTDHNYCNQLKRLGIPDKFIDHGKTEELYHEYGLDQQGIYKSIKAFMLEN